MMAEDREREGDGRSEGFIYVFRKVGDTLTSSGYL